MRARAHTHAHTHTYARTHARTRAHTRTHAHTHTDGEGERGLRQALLLAPPTPSHTSFSRAERGGRTERRERVRERETSGLGRPHGRAAVPSSAGAPIFYQWRLTRRFKFCGLSELSLVNRSDQHTAAAPSAACSPVGTRAARGIRSARGTGVRVMDPTHILSLFLSPLIPPPSPPLFVS